MSRPKDNFKKARKVVPVDLIPEIDKMIAIYKQTGHVVTSGYRVTTETVGELSITTTERI